MQTKRLRVFAMTVIFFVACRPSHALEELAVLVTPQLSPQERIAQQHKQLMAQAIKHINKVCGLTDRQHRKLIVASKGAVDRKGLTKLEQLALDGSKVTDAGLVHLTGLTNLEVVGLERTKVTDDGAKKLQTALPNCDILR